MGNVGERAAVHECWRAAQGLDQVRVQGIAHKRGECAFCVELTCGDGLLIVGVADGDVTEALLQILEVRSQAQDCHDFGRCGDGETSFCRDSVGGSTESGDDVAQCTVVDVEAALPGHTSRIDA